MFIYVYLCLPMFIYVYPFIHNIHHAHGSPFVGQGIATNNHSIWIFWVNGNNLIRIIPHNQRSQTITIPHNQRSQTITTNDPKGFWKVVISFYMIENDGIFIGGNPCYNLINLSSQHGSTAPSRVPCSGFQGRQNGAPLPQRRDWNDSRCRWNFHIFPSFTQKKLGSVKFGVFWCYHMSVM